MVSLRDLGLLMIWFMMYYVDVLVSLYRLHLGSLVLVGLLLPGWALVIYLRGWDARTSFCI